MILIHRTYEVWDEQAFDTGETNSGFLSENEEVTFRELVELLREYTDLSSYPATGSVCDWVSCNAEENWQTGEHEVRSLHYSSSNPARKAKYWRKAFIAAGLIK